MIAHLQAHFPTMHSLYEVLKIRGSLLPPTDEEKAIANGTVHPTDGRMKMLIPATANSNTLPGMFGRLTQLNQVYIVSRCSFRGDATRTLRRCFNNRFKHVLYQLLGFWLSLCFLFTHSF